jgi:hypothetical protein
MVQIGAPPSDKKPPVIGSPIGSTGARCRTPPTRFSSISPRGFAKKPRY